MQDGDHVWPVRKVGDIIVVGERHEDCASGSVLRDVWNLCGDIGAVCVEVGGDMNGYRRNAGAAIGSALVKAEKENIPRYYVDESVDTVVEAFGSKISAYRYLKKLERTYPTHSEGYVNPENVSEVREEYRDNYGREAHKLLFLKRERMMAGRAKWVSERVEGSVILVVGCGHLFAIERMLREGVDAVEVEDSRKRTGERVAANLGPWGTMFTVFMEEFEALLQRMEEGFGST